LRLVVAWKFLGVVSIFEPLGHVVELTHGVQEKFGLVEHSHARRRAYDRVTRLRVPAGLNLRYPSA
jgi:hypothetical protein